jgi:hypothetical protein
MNRAFSMLRDYARAHNQTIYDTAAKVVGRKITL